MPGNSRNVVAEASGGVFATVNILEKYVLVRNGASKFQIGISDGAMWVGGRDKSSLNVPREQGVPQNGLKAGVGHSWKPDPVHAQCCRIGCPKSHWKIGDDLRETSGVRAKVTG
jgi:hypothetical protein